MSDDTGSLVHISTLGVTDARPAAERPSDQVNNRGRIILLVSTILFAIIAQQLAPTSTTGALVLLYVCGAITALLLNSTAKQPIVSTNMVLSTLSNKSRRWVLPISTGAALICTAISAASLGSNASAAGTWWLVAMGIPIVALLAARPDAWRTRGWQRSTVNWSEIGIIGVLFAAALVFRLPALTYSPPFVHGDEANSGLLGRLFNQGQAPLLSIAPSSLPMLSYAISGLGMRFFGNDLLGLRLTNAVIGSASIVLTYLLGRELFNRRAAFLGALLLAVTFLDVDLSRNGVHSIQGPVFVTLTLYVLVRWLRHGGALSAFLTGLSVIADLQVYWGARVAVVLVVALVIFLDVRERPLLEARARESGWVFLGLVVAGLPVVSLFLANPGSFSTRNQAVSIFTPEAVQSWPAMYGASSTVLVLLQQAWRTWLTFTTLGDTSLNVGWGGTILDTVSAALLPAALLLAILRVRHWQYALLLGWFGAVFAAGTTTISPPWWPRLAAFLPAVALLIGVLLAETLRFADRSVTPRLRPLAGGSVALLLICITIGNARVAFIDYPRVTLQAEMMKPTLIGNFLAHAPGADKTVLLSDGSFYVDYVTVQFLAPHAGGCTLTPGQPLSACPLTRVSRLYVLFASRVNDLAWLRRQRPGGKTVYIGAWGNGADRVIAYELPSSRAAS